MARTSKPNNKNVDPAIIEMSKAKYLHTIGYVDMKKDKHGFIKLIPTAEHVDKQEETLTTSISALESKLKKFKEEKEKVEKLKDTDHYKESKKGKKKKKQKKEKQNLLEMLFNNADEQSKGDDESSDDDDGYKDPKTPSEKKDKRANSLDTTYGKRFSPVVALLHDSIVEFDSIAVDIQEDLNSRASAKTVYRSSQIANLISAKNSKLSAVKELATVARIVSDLEYKKSKDDKAVGGNENKAISALGAKYLRGFDAFSDLPSKKKDKKKDKDSLFGGSSKSKKADDDDDDDEDEEFRIERQKDERELAQEFAKTLTSKRGSITLTPHERYISMEGKYKFIVAANERDPENDWKFVAVDPKTDKEIKGFKDDYKDLMPKKKDCRMVFDLGKGKVTDKNTSRSYKLYLK